jgi:hypothetical protein
MLYQTITFTTFCSHFFIDTQAWLCYRHPHVTSKQVIIKYQNYKGGTMKSKFSMRNKFFSVGMIFFLMLFVIACSSSNDTAPATYSISGAVTGATPADVTGVTINLTGAATASTTTDASGTFSITGLSDGAYTVTPVKAGYIFNPVSLVASVSGASVTGINFVATATGASTYSISGKVTGDVLKDVTITLRGGTNGTATTDASGNYSFSNIVNGSYTVTPSRTGYTFTPANLNIPLSGAISPGNDFTSAAVVIPPATTASGTYTWNSTTGVITLNTTSSNFTCQGPSLGAETHTGVTITSTTMTWPNDNMTWSRSSGTANDIVGTWTSSDSTTGNSYTAIFNANGTVSVGGVIVTCGGGGGNAGTYTQADLTGTWYMNNLSTGNNKWMRAKFSINSSGVATCLSMSDSGGGISCPSPFDLTLTMNPSTGVITQSGYDASNAGTGHMTMTSNKNFAAGTSTNGDSPNYKYQLAIMQKVVTGTSYSNADLQGKSFVTHELDVSNTPGDSGWSYSAGTIDGTGLATISSGINSWGNPSSGTATISVDANGVVTQNNYPSFQGFLSADKKTIVVTSSSNGSSPSPQLMIIQITGQTYTAGLLPAGISAQHMLAGGVTPAPFWLHFTSTVASGGVMTFSDWVSSNSAVTAPGTTSTGSITSSGTVTIAGNPTYHGQVSHDGKFIVGTQTISSGVYSLSVNTQ